MNGIYPCEMDRGLTFNDCVRRLGPPHRTVQKAPVIRIAWWDVGEVTYRVEFLTEDYKDHFRDGKQGELRLLAVYQRSLAPDGFDDKFEFWKDLEGKK